MSLYDCRLYCAIQLVSIGLLSLSLDFILLVRSAFLLVSDVPPCDNTISICSVCTEFVELPVCIVRCPDRNPVGSYLSLDCHSHIEVRPSLHTDPAAIGDIGVCPRYDGITDHLVVDGVSQTAAGHPSKAFHHLRHHPRRYHGVRMYFW